MSTYNFEIVQGDSIDKTITVGTFSLSGYSCKGQMRRDPQSIKAIDFTMTISNDNKSITWHLDPTVSAAIIPGIYVYQIEIISTTITMTLLMGEITVLAEISR